jgi:uncharacterized protein
MPTNYSHIVRPTRREGEYGVIVIRDVMVAMRDGTRLATDLYLPAINDQPAPGRFPSVLERMPYDKSFSMIGPASGEYWAKLGYVYVIQDCRGRYKSEGAFVSYPAEADDGEDAARWLVQQPWSDGRFVASGSSYFASTAQAILCRNPPGLVAAVLRVGSGDYHEDGAWCGGAFLVAHNINYALDLAATSQDADADAKRTLTEALQADSAIELMRRSPLAAGASVLALTLTDKNWYQDWQNHELRDEYWTQEGYAFNRAAAPDIPILLIGNWYDSFAGGIIDSHLGYAENKSSPVQTIMGGGDHYSVYSMSSVTGDVDMGDDAPVDVQAVAGCWLDQFVKGIGANFSEGRTFYAFRIEGGEGEKTASGALKAGGSWQKFDSWPPTDARTVEFYLSDNQDLSLAVPPNGSMSYLFDPASPVPTVGGSVSSGANVVASGPMDQRGDLKWPQCTDTRDLADRADVLSFTTAPLERDTEVSGPLSVVLYVSSSAVDTDFTAKLIDQYPPSDAYPSGYAMNIQDGIVRARLRDFTVGGNGYRRIYGHRERPLKPGEICEVTVDLVATSVLFKKGHRIRLDVSSSNFPRFDVNPNTGEQFAKRKLPPIVAHNTVHVGADHPSRLVLSLR